jgi:hypothetical protein
MCWQVGVDLTYEIRVERCDVCYRSLHALRPRLAQLVAARGEMAGRAGELLTAMDVIYLDV